MPGSYLCLHYIVLMQNSLLPAQVLEKQETRMGDLPEVWPNWEVRACPVATRSSSQAYLVKVLGLFQRERDLWIRSADPFRLRTRQHWPILEGGACQEASLASGSSWLPKLCGYLHIQI